MLLTEYSDTLLIVEEKKHKHVFVYLLFIKMQIQITCFVKKTFIYILKPDLSFRWIDSIIVILLQAFAFVFLYSLA